MRLRTEDVLGYFSAQMLGQLALPHVAKEAVQRVALHGSRASGKGAARQLAESKSDGVGYVAHVDRASGAVRVVAGPAAELPGESLTDALYRAAATTGVHEFTVDEMRSWGSIEEMDAEIAKAAEPIGELWSGETLTRRAKRLVEAMSKRMRPPSAESVFIGCGGCSRVVTLADWSSQYELCTECAEDAERAGDNRDEFMAELDRLRLLGEFTD